MSAVLDTHAALWYLLETARLSKKAFAVIDAAAASGSPACVSAISLIEIVYLVERGRIAANAYEKLLREMDQANPPFRIIAVDAAIADAMKRISRADVPDMPDRIIAATALYLGLPLITRDQKLQSSDIETIW